MIARQSRLAALLFVLAGATVFCAYFVGVQHSQPVLWSDTYEYADVARNIAEGKGVVIHSATVMEIWMLRPRSFPVPYFFHDIGQSLLMGFFFRILGATERTIGWSSGAFFILLPALTFLLGLRLSGEARIARLAGLLVLINAQMLAYSVTGLSELPYAFFLSLFLLALYGASGPWCLVLAGLGYGALVTLRSNSLPFLPLVATYVWFEARDAEGRPPSSRSKARQGLVGLLLFMLGFAVPFVPNAVRSYEGLGRPIGTVASAYMPLFYTSAIEGKSKTLFSQPGLPVDPVQFLWGHPGELIRKVQYQLSATVRLLLSGGGIEDNWADASLIFLFLLGALAPPPGETRRGRRFRWLVYGLLIAALAAGSLFHLRWRHLYGFVPVVTIYVAELVVRLLGQRGGLRGQAGFLLLLLAFGMGRVWLVDPDPEPEPSEGASLQRYRREIGGFIARKTPPDAIILARVGGLGELRALGWYSGRSIVELSDYTLATLDVAPRTLYLVLGQGPGAIPARAEDPPPGFVRVKNWESDAGGGTLFRKR